MRPDFNTARFAAEPFPHMWIPQILRQEDANRVLGWMQTRAPWALRDLLRSKQTIRIHNDYLDGEETHRLLIQLNAGWDRKQGGLLMLFGDKRPESLARTIVPTHGSGFAFEISQASFHAVSSITDGERFTLVYTFRRTRPKAR